MRHGRGLRIALAALIAGALLGPSSAAGSNDTMATAEGPATSSIIGSISTTNDVDWYFMWASAYTQLDAAITGLGPENSCQSWNLVLRDSEGHDLDSVYATFNHVRHILYTLEAAGTYYLEVSGFYCEAAGNYRVDLAASPALLTSPPYVPPPAAPAISSPSAPSRGGSSGASPACQRARSRMAAIGRRINRVHSSRQRKRLRAQFRRARARAKRLC